MLPLTRISALGAALAALLILVATVAPASASASIEVHVVAGSRAAPGPVSAPAQPPTRLSRTSTAMSSSVRVANADEVGVRTNGKLVGLDPRRGSFSCSGTAINTPSRSIVLTAGHCVVVDGSAAKKLSFVPAYDHGSRPFGSFAVTDLYVMPQWRNSENPDFDVAALRVAPNRFGALTDVVGARGYATSRSRTAQFQIYGYPAAALKGEELRACAARGLGSDPLTFPYPGPPTLPGACDMAAGASGGGWILAGEYVNGVTSYGYVTRPDRLYSPYFGPTVGGFLKALP